MSEGQKKETTAAQSSVSRAPSFMSGHRAIGSATTDLYGNEIRVSASAHAGEGRVGVYGHTKEGQHIGGLMGVPEARHLLALLKEAVAHAEGIAALQRPQEIARLEAKVAALTQDTAQQWPPEKTVAVRGGTANG